MTINDALTIRPATVADARALGDLAALDSARPLAGPVLVAEVAGRPVAALALDEDRAVADPFEPTAAVVATLRAHASATAMPHRRGAARHRLRRLAHARLRPVRT